MIRKAISAFCAVVVLCFVSCFAAETEVKGMTARFDCSEPDENGVFVMTVSFDNMRFIAYQFSVRYDTAVVEPYCRAENRAAKSFNEFADSKVGGGLNAIGELLIPDKGIFDFTGFVLRGTEFDEALGLEWDGNEAVTKENLVIYKLCFRTKGEGSPNFEIAFNDGNGEYYEMFPQGAAVFGSEGMCSAEAVFTYGGQTLTQSFDAEQYAVNAAMTKAQRLENTLYLQNGNYACAEDGVLKVIDQNDKALTPLMSDGKLFVPLRYVCEYFGFEVLWDESGRTASVTADSGTYVISPDEKSVTHDGESLEADAAFICRDRLMITAETLSQITGLELYMPDGKNSAVITSGEKWNPLRYAEKAALSAMQLVVSPFVKIFV